MQFEESGILEHIHIGMKLDGLYRVDVPEIDQDGFPKKERTDCRPIPSGAFC